jgi:hypothetical protein
MIDLRELTLTNQTQRVDKKYLEISGGVKHVYTTDTIPEIIQNILN